MGQLAETSTKPTGFSPGAALHAAAELPLSGDDAGDGVEGWYDNQTA